MPEAEPLALDDRAEDGVTRRACGLTNADEDPPVGLWVSMMIEVALLCQGVAQNLEIVTTRIGDPEALRDIDEDLLNLTGELPIIDGPQQPAELRIALGAPPNVRGRDDPDQRLPEPTRQGLPNAAQDRGWILNTRVLLLEPLVALPQQPLNGLLGPLQVWLGSLLLVHLFPFHSGFNPLSTNQGWERLIQVQYEGEAAGQARKRPTIHGGKTS